MLLSYIAHCTEVTDLLLRLLLLLLPFFETAAETTFYDTQTKHTAFMCHRNSGLVTISVSEVPVVLTLIWVKALKNY